MSNGSSHNERTSLFPYIERSEAESRYLVKAIQYMMTCK